MMRRTIRSFSTKGTATRRLRPSAPPVEAAIFQSAVCRTTAVPRPSPSLFYFPGLRAASLWSRAEELRPAEVPPKACADEALPWLQELEKPENVESMRREFEALRAANVESDYSTKDASREGGEHKMHHGEWSWNTWISKGARQESFEERCPETARLLSSIAGSALMTGTPFAFSFFSTLHGQSSIAPHSAPCNLRLRCHLPLVTTSTDSAECGMRVGNDVVPWQEGKTIVFDDSYEHETWNRTSQDRTVLLFDVWHPDLTFAERIAITDMFSGAAKAGP